MSSLYLPDVEKETQRNKNGGKKQGSEGAKDKKRRKCFLEVAAKLAVEKRMRGGPEDDRGGEGLCGGRGNGPKKDGKSPAKINLPLHLRASRTSLLGLSVCVCV